MEKVLFDPGYSACILGISDSADFMYSAFINAPAPLKTKRFQFSMLFSKIKKMVEANIAFYLGCLLWAVYIKSKTGAVIENNPCSGEKFEEESALEETNFLLELVTSKLNKDAKYYINKTYCPRAELEPVLRAYAEFLKLNKGFVSVEKTDDIILPDSVKTPNATDLLQIKETIDRALDKKDLTELFGAFGLIL